MSLVTGLKYISDILAELDYPHSGLSAYEEKLQYPSNVVSEDSFRQLDLPSTQEGLRIDLYYSAQLFLRTRLNRMHANLYSTSCE